MKMLEVFTNRREALHRSLLRSGQKPSEAVDRFAFQRIRRGRMEAELVRIEALHSRVFTRRRSGGRFARARTAD
jgi:hypothetical protein